MENIVYHTVFEMFNILQRAGELKHKLIEFSGKNLFNQERNKAWLKYFGPITDISMDQEGKYINFLDYFILEWKLSNGDTIADCFTKENKKLIDEEKNIINNWKKVFSGIFQVKKILTDGFILINLIDNTEYTVKSTTSLDPMIKKSDFLLSRILPLENYYIFSGATSCIPAKNKVQIYQLVTDFLKRCPSAIFAHNEKELREAYNLQEEEYNDFVEFFGTDEIILSGKEIQGKLKEFYHYRYFQKKDPVLKKTKAELFQKKRGHLPTLPELNFPAKILETEEIGVIYDKREGLNFFAWYGIFKEIFFQEDFKNIPGYQEIIAAYLTSPTISALPFIRMAEQYKDNAERVFKDIFGIDNFSIPKDLYRLLEKYKPDYKISTPSIIPVKGKIKDFLQSQKIGRTQPCPCGSGKKYKNCCGQVC